MSKETGPMRTASASISASLCLLLGFLGAFYFGCDGSDQAKQDAPQELRDDASETSARPVPILGQTVESVFADAIDVYSRAKVYSDEGRVELVCETERDGRKRSFNVPCALTFAKPNYVRMEFGSALLRSDGQILRAEILEDGFRDRKIETPAPIMTTSIRELYPDARFAQAADIGVPKEIFWTSPQLVLLLAKDPFRTLAPEGADRTLLEPEYLIERGARRACERVKISDSFGERVFWFDRETKTLARCELSVEGVAAPERGVKATALRIEFPKQKISDVPLDERSARQFAMEDAQNQRDVQRFLPTEALPLKRRFPEETLRSLEENQSLPTIGIGRETTLFFWSSSDPNDERLDALRSFEASRANVDDAVVVACAPSEISDDVVRAEASALGLNAPLARLDRAELKKLDPDLGSIVTPVILKLDGNGVVQSCERANGETNLEFDEEARRFAASVALASENDLWRVDPSPTFSPIPKRLAPKTFDLREIWRVEDLSAPCEPLALESGALIVPCDGNALALIDANGKLLRKTTPAAAAGEPIEFVQTARSDSVRRYYVAASRGRSGKLHRFDEDLNDLGSLDLEQAFDRLINDAAFVDSNDDGEPELILCLVGRDGSGAVCSVDMTTQKMLWKNENFSTPYRLDALSVPDGTRLFVAERANGRPNEIVELDPATGERLGEIRPNANESIEDFATSDNTTDDGAQIAALATSFDDGGTLLVGFDARGTRLWQTSVAGDLTTRPERVSSGDVDGDGLIEWIVVGNDGTIRFFRNDGGFFDAYRCGEEIAGARIANLGSESRLLVAESEKISALKFEKKR